MAAVRDCYSSETISGAVRRDPVFPVEQDPKEFTRNRQWRKSEPDNEGNRVYINVPYHEKHLAKPFGAKWDRVRQSWWMSRQDFDNSQNKPDFKKSWIMDESTTEPEPFQETKWSSDDFPEGLYALFVEDEWRFFRVRFGKNKWTGHTFLERKYGHDTITRVYSPKERESILKLIALNPKKASIDYGLQKGVCGLCNTELFKPESIAAGIGPICRAKVGW